MLVEQNPDSKKKFVRLTRQHLSETLPLPRPANLLKQVLHCSCSPVRLVMLYRTPVNGCFWTFVSFLLVSFFVTTHSQAAFLL